MVQYPELIRKMPKRAREGSKIKICHRGKACPVARLETPFPEGPGMSPSMCLAAPGPAKPQGARFGETLRVCTVRAMS